MAGGADAAGSITVSNGGSFGGGQTPNDASLESQFPPASITFPQLDPSDTDFASAGWSVDSIPTAQCAAFFGDSPFSDFVDPFMAELETITTKTVIFAPTCAVKYSGTHTFGLNADVALDVKSLSLTGTNTFGSYNPEGLAQPAHHELSLLASTWEPCSTSQPYINVSNRSSFSAPQLSVFMFTPGEVIYGDGMQGMDGEIMACGGMTGTNSFNLTFDKSAAATLGVPDVLSPLTITPLERFLVK